MATSPIEVQVGASGRLVIPAPLRHELDLKSGDRLIGRIEDGRLIFEKRETIIQRLKGQFADLRGQEVIDDLIAQRRLEAEPEVLSVLVKFT
ncbi:AbrB/MazE/SpoVT family DNA-binding domain-containing protein [Candidatus Synechococcus calcipolaris G9]|uniref:AbrB/MazE/SpoVT family DNA-binding domain-containing protein n=1 Tax=Candidatus Synechococcus calcipolaris G9 TaxID=1497997 RepID=A0ABT6EVY2_9SYNE|nr:AbrB/MazE/SpoVT family DNA-binding domain-containing protein [Candidatus Synechococcus calcipolaris]MDG2989674.1 AbrB/MazE/SpoVT family DNA-binding domain-containing protein [Candidatus Synechococcus calcipolaris G9]